MQELTTISETEYRGLRAKNFSLLKDFVKMGLHAFYKKYVLGLDVEDKDSAPLAIGSAVDCILTEGMQAFDEKFHIGGNIKIPSGKGGVFAQKLFEICESGVSFGIAFKRAYQEADMSEKLYNSFVEKFEGSEIKSYFDCLNEGKGKITISSGDAATAEKIVEVLTNHSRTRALFEMDGYSQQVVVFDYNGHQLKCKLDRVVVDNRNKILKPFDLKVLYSTDDFEFRYLKDSYYLQEAIYTLGVEHFRDKYYPDYAIDDFKFCVAHNLNTSLPVIYNLKIEDGKGDLYEGFQTKSGRRYKGLNEILFELSWHEENNIWNSTYEVHNNKGIITKIL